MKELILYLKTTESCQLNCAHCFTGGNASNAKLFDPDATVEWMQRLSQVVRDPKGTVIFHGGEPFLTPVESMRRVWASTRDLFPNLSWTTTTNLTYKLDDEKIQFMKTAFDGVITTSWDRSIRFATRRQLELWEKNVTVLNNDYGFTSTVIVSLAKDVLEMRPLEVITYLISLGFKEIHLERIALTGNALLNQQIIPSNKELDEWIVQFWDDWLLVKPWTRGITNSFFNDVLTTLVYGQRRGCRARACEKKILTVNANGTVGGCPNNAVEKSFGSIRDDVRTLLWSPGRLCNIQAEQHLNPKCFECPVFDLCNGDCQNLKWDSSCPAPKSWMMKLKAESNPQLFAQVLGGVSGESS